MGALKGGVRRKHSDAFKAGRAYSISADQPIQISPNTLWLDICGWSVPADFPTSAAGK